MTLKIGPYLGIAIYRSELVATLPPGLSPEAAKAAQETLAGAMTAAGQIPARHCLVLLNRRLCMDCN